MTSTLEHADIHAATSRCDWAQVLRLVEDDPRLDPIGRLGRFSRNMLVLRRRNPKLATAVERAPDSGRVVFLDRAPGRPSIGVLTAQGKPAHDLARDAITPADLNAKLTSQRRPRSPVAVLGIGNGAIIDELARETPDGLGYERAVFIIEPHLEFFRAALMLSAWDDGPLKDERFTFFIGANWADQLVTHWEQDVRVPPPGLTIQARSMSVDELTEASRVMPELHDRFTRRADALWQEVAKRDAGRTVSAAADALGTQGARVLLLTTRFSTVLQHSTQDFATAFRACGYETEVAIEAAPWHRHTRLSLLERIKTFHPDLVVQIDHHRAEHAGLVPAQIPFVCIVQDNLPNLTTREAGEKLTTLDFVAGPWVHKYIREYGYPPQQCIELPRLAHEPALSHRMVPHSEPPSLLYVSNHSSTFERALVTACASFPQSSVWHALLTRSANLIRGAYTEGRCFEDASEVRSLVWEEAGRMGIKREQCGLAMTHVIESLSVHINNPLYRQQGLAWAHQVARDMGIELHVHGAGWEHHPTFAEVARGPIAYGPALVEATRRATFCLMLEPFFPTSHQRSIDAWMSGGCVLIRSRARDRHQAQFMELLDGLPERACTYAMALRWLDPSRRAQFEAMYQDHQKLDPSAGQLDHVALHRDRQRAGMSDLMRHPPHYDQISFVDAASLRHVITHLLGQPQHAARIVAEQRRWVIARFSYESGVRRLVASMQEALRT